MQIFSFSPFGYEGALVSVEVDLRRGIPAVDIVGLADGAVKESRERMRSAIRNSGFEFPPERVLISLSPADLKKEGAGFDLAVALAVLKARENCGSDDSKARSESDDILVLGELELNGRVRPVKAVHAAASTAWDYGIRRCIVPLANEQEAREVHGMKVFGAETLCDAFKALHSEELFTGRSGESYAQEQCLPDGAVNVGGVYFGPVQSGMDFAEVHGQERLVRALQICAAGGHNLLAFGAPGCGKSLSLQKFPSILPLLTVEEAQPVTRIYSIAGLLKNGQSMIRIPPFRQPHQTASIEGICGGGMHCTPGEISLAHNGVLFLDEAAEFRTSVLQMLRVPLESGSVTLSRAGRSTVFPADFQLLMATNPCPCGFYGSRDKICLCSARSVEMYWKKFSGPLLDRIDVRVQVESNPDSRGKSISSDDLRTDIAHAVLAQRKRQGKKNAALTPGEISDFCICDPDARELLTLEAERYGLSPRAVASCLKLARTIADLAGKLTIDRGCMEEALSFRKTEGGLAGGIEGSIA